MIVEVKLTSVLEGTTYTATYHVPSDSTTGAVLKVLDNLSYEDVQLLDQGTFSAVAKPIESSLQSVAKDPHV